MADTKPDGFESFVRLQMFEIDNAPEINIWNDQLDDQVVDRITPSGHQALNLPTVTALGI